MKIRGIYQRETSHSPERTSLYLATAHDAEVADSRVSLRVLLMFGHILLVFCAAVSSQTNDRPNRGRTVYADCGTPYELVVLAVNYKVGQLFMITDERYFAEQDLVRLFRCISIKYPEF